MTPNVNYQHFPHYMINSDGKGVIVDTVEEEKAVNNGCLHTGRNPNAIVPTLLGSSTVGVGSIIQEDLLTPSAPVKEVVKAVIPDIPTINDIPSVSELTSNNNIESLRLEADSYGVIYDKRWGIDRLSTAINDAKKKSA